MLASQLSGMLSNHAFLGLTQFLGVGDPIIPLVFIAIMLAATIVSIWYIIGILLNNPGVKAAARGEAYQLLGTIILVGMVIFVLYLFATLFLMIAGTTPLLSPQAMSTLCQNLAGYNGQSNGSGLQVVQEALGPPTNICTILNDPGASVTTALDYPLAAVSAITAGMTTQASYNFNSMFIFDAWLGFLKNFHPTIALCWMTWQPYGTPASCWFPLPTGTVSTPATVYLKWSTQPYAGFEMLYKSMGTFGSLLMTSLVAYVIQLLFQNLFLNIWPFLFFLGIIFRATVFTRRLGGLLIAVAIGAVVIYPVLFSIQYLSINDILLNNHIQITYGSGGPNPPYVYNESFYSMPDIAQIAYASGCWPNGGSLAGQEFTTIALYNNPITGVPGFIYNLYTQWFNTGTDQLSINLNDVTGSNAQPYFNYAANSGQSLFTPCDEGTALNATLYIIYAYGITAVTAFFLPIINIIITLSAIRGISGLLGGDTDLAGISKFI